MRETLERRDEERAEERTREEGKESVGERDDERVREKLLERTEEERGAAKGKKAPERKTEERIGESTKEKIKEKVTEKAEEKFEERTREKVKEMTGERVEDGAKEKSPERTEEQKKTAKGTGTPERKTEERMGGRAKEEIKEKVAEKAVEKLEERPNGPAQEKAEALEKQQQDMLRRDQTTTMPSRVDAEDEAKRIVTEEVVEHLMSSGKSKIPEGHFSVVQPADTGTPQLGLVTAKEVKSLPSNKRRKIVQMAVEAQKKHKRTVAVGQKLVAGKMAQADTTKQPTAARRKLQKTANVRKKLPVKAQQRLSAKKIQPRRPSFK